MENHEIALIESKIKEFIEEISSLEMQRRKEETALENHEKTKLDIESHDELIWEHANNINATKSSLSEKKRKFDFLRKSEHACILFMKIIIPVGTLLSIIIGLLNGVVAGMVMFILSNALGIASISLSQSIFHKYKTLNGEIMSEEDVLDQHTELLKGTAERKRNLISRLLSKENEKLSHINLTNIEDNIHYYESQIKRILNDIPSDFDTEYISEVRDCYFGSAAEKVSVPRYTPNN